MTLCNDGRPGRRKRARVDDLGTKHIRIVGVMITDALLAVN